MQCSAPGDVIPLYCIASGHSTTYTYDWSNTDGLVGVNSPVYYATRAGTYRCSVSDGSRVCSSKAIVVPEGTLMITYLCEMIVYVLSFSVHRYA